MIAFLRYSIYDSTYSFLNLGWISNTQTWLSICSLFLIGSVYWPWKLCKGKMLACGFLNKVVQVLFSLTWNTETDFSLLLAYSSKAGKIVINIFYSYAIRERVIWCLGKITGWIWMVSINGVLWVSSLGQNQSDKGYYDEKDLSLFV